MKTKAEALDALKAAGLSTVIAELDPLIWSSIRVVAQSGGQSPVGASRLGGLPDLAPGTAWPQWNNAPMSFVAQFDLAQVKNFDAQKALPPSGLLSFFYDSNQQNFGSDPVNSGQWKVLYSKVDTTALQPLAAPGNMPSKRLFKACSVGYSTEVTLPLDTSAFGLTWDKQTLDRYSDFMASFPTPQDRKSTHHRLLGHPDQIQDDMHLQIALETKGRKPDQITAADQRDARDWRLLFQVDTDEGAGMDWANNGMLYYWIRSDALQAQNFDNVWLAMQSE